MVSRRLLRIKIFQILYAYFTNDSGDVVRFKKELNHSINKTHELYFKFLLLIIDFKEVAINKIESDKNKNLPSLEELNPNTRFINSPIIAKLEESEALNAYFKTIKVSWVTETSLVNKLFKKIIASEYYKEYMTGNGGAKADKSLIYNIFEQTILECEDITEYLENDSIYWNDELEFVIDMIIKTIKSIDVNSDRISILPLFKQDSDKEFMEELFVKTINNHEKNKELISKYIKNWDADRLAFNDMLLMEMAITELTAFNDIPVRVTLNEYIELAKFYSTKQSGGFVNGILDKIIKDFKKSGEIKKSGMGLKGEV